MRHILLGLAVAGVGGICGQKTVSAQQPPRRSVTYVFQQTSVTKMQWSPDSANAVSAPANGGSASSTTVPGMLPSSIPGGDANASVSPPAVDANGFSQKPNVQQVQNPSGAYNFSPVGTNQGQYVSANNYLGAQFNNWNNLRQQPRTLDEFQAFNRTQPPAPVPSGAYVSSNNYFGPAFSQWNNLSSGSVTPNYLGGYIYQQ